MDDRRARRERCRVLADRLILEYADAVAPGQVLAAVFRAHHFLAGQLELSVAAKMDICESSARRLLTDQVSARGADTGAGKRRARA
jgi:hypothetical protein